MNEENAVFTQRKLPADPLSLILGIISIFGCCCYGLPGIVLGLIGLLTANRSITEYNADPDGFTDASLKNVNTGRILSIIGLIISALALLISIVFIAIYGFSAIGDPDKIREIMEGSS